MVKVSNFEPNTLHVPLIELDWEIVIPMLHETISRKRKNNDDQSEPVKRPNLADSNDSSDEFSEQLSFEIQDVS